jgi:hypothetical protein
MVFASGPDHRALEVVARELADRELAAGDQGRKRAAVGELAIRDGAVAEGSLP